MSAPTMGWVAMQWNSHVRARFQKLLEALATRLDGRIYGIGLGGPDIVPWRPSQMKNSYPFFHEYRGRLPLVAMAVQGATLTYINPKTNRRFTKPEFVRFARDYLGVNIIFWSVHAPWLDYRPPSARQ